MMLRGTHPSFVIPAEAGIHTGEPRKSPRAARLMDSRLRGNDGSGRRTR
jgi:hypothetical protein